MAKDRLKQAFVAGLLVLVPVGMLVLVVEKLADLLGGIAGMLGETSLLVTFAATAGALAVAALIVVGIGLAALAPAGRALVRSAEEAVFTRLPGYAILRRVAEGWAEEGDDHGVALMRHGEDGPAQFCIVVETLPDGRAVVFAPSSPAMTVGAVYVVAPDRLEALSARPLQLSGVMSGWGAGAGAAIAPAP